MRYKNTIKQYLDPQDIDNVLVLTNALNNQYRIEILNCLQKGPKTYTELSHEVGIPSSNIVFHINVLEKAKFVKIITSGKTAVVSILATNFYFALGKQVKKTLWDKIDKTIEYEIPVGNYLEVSGTKHLFFELLSKDGVITSVNYNNLYDPERINASLLLLNRGYVVYPLKTFKDYSIKEIFISFEMCSETAFFKNDLKSDVRIKINGVELCIVNLLGDFGGRRGLLNPSWYGDDASQYGSFINIVVSDLGVTLNGALVNPKIKIDDLHFNKFKNSTLTFEVMPDLPNCSGFNLFGKHFGDYPQDIKVKYKIKKNK